MTIWWWSDYLIKTKPNCRQPHQGLEALRAWRQRNEELCCAQTTEEADWKKSRANGSHGSGTLQKGSRPICPLLELWWGFLPDFAWCFVKDCPFTIFHLFFAHCSFTHMEGLPLGLATVSLWAEATPAAGRESPAGEMARWRSWLCVVWFRIDMDLTWFNNT